MKYTNRMGLSNAMRDAIISFNEDYDSVGWKSVTTLCDAPRIQLLRARHGDKLTSDVSDLFWSFFGNLGHLVAERNAGEDVIAEQRFIEIVDGKEISFKPDRLEKNVGEVPLTWTLRDFKFTSVWILKRACKGDVKVEWERQMNMYVYLLGLAGFVVSNIELEIIGRDWRKSEYIQNPRDYPPTTSMILNVPVWTSEKQESYLKERIALYKECEELSDSKLPHCTKDERWGSDDKYTVVKKDGTPSKETGFRKTVYRGGFFKSNTDALEFIQKKRIPKPLKSKNPKQETIDKALAAAIAEADGMEVEFRKGESKRCEDYCELKDFCSQYVTEISPAF